MTISNFHSKTFHLVSVEKKIIHCQEVKKRMSKSRKKMASNRTLQRVQCDSNTDKFHKYHLQLGTCKRIFFSELISKNINNIQQEWTKTKSANCYLTLVNPAAASMLCFVQSLLSKLLRNYHFLENWLSWSYEWLDLIFTQSIMFGQDVWNAAVWLWRELRYEANQKSVRFIYVTPNYKKMSQSTLQKKKKNNFLF